MVFYSIRCKDSSFLQNYEASSKEMAYMKHISENLYREGMYDASPWADWTCMSNSNEVSAKWPHGMDVIKIANCIQEHLVLEGTEEIGVAFVPHWIWKAVMGGTLKEISSPEGIFSTRPEKPIRDVVVVTHNEICVLSLNHLGFKREELWVIIRLACSPAEDERRLLWKRSGGWKGYG